MRRLICYGEDRCRAGCNPPPSKLERRRSQQAASGEPNGAAEARKKAALTQKEVAGRLKREDGRVVDVPYLNAMEHDRRYPPSNHLIDQLAEIVGIPADWLYFHAKRLPGDIRRNVDKAERLRDSAVRPARFERVRRRRRDGSVAKHFLVAFLFP